MKPLNARRGVAGVVLLAWRVLDRIGALAK
jgi:hypothetical protein